MSTDPTTPLPWQLAIQDHEWKSTIVTIDLPPVWRPRFLETHRFVTAVQLPHGTPMPDLDQVGREMVRISGHMMLPRSTTEALRYLEAAGETIIEAWAQYAGRTHGIARIEDAE